MNMYHACEVAYKNGYAAGELSKEPDKVEIGTRVKVAYEQLASCRTRLCQSANKGESDKLVYKLQEAMDKLLDIQVILGVLEAKEGL